MTFQRLSISIILIVLSLVHISASLRQATNNCPPVDLCNFINCTNGNCISDNTMPGCYRCNCPAGYTGQLCETLIATSNGCNPPCQNNGQCITTGTNNFVCACPSDYTGNQCETSVISTHICVTMQATICLNGGTCTMNGAGFICNCQAGFSGVNCEIEDSTTVCTANLCGTHGTCQQLILPAGGFIPMCICAGQWTGKHCEISLANSCTVDFCQAGGTCITTGTTTFCVCPPTHTGPQCETAISTLPTTMTTSTTITGTLTTTTGTLTTTTGTFFTTTSAVTVPTGGCSSNPCLNSGSCFNTGNSFICLCTPLYSGPTCSILNSATTSVATTTSNVNACLPNPCQNNGVCYKYGSSFVCVCASTHTGQICDVVKTTVSPVNTTPSTAITCASQPCKNGATCYNAGNSYYCYCGVNNNFSGVNCDTPKPTSDSSCPLNCASGSCVVASYSPVTYACMCNGTLKPTSC